MRNKFFFLATLLITAFCFSVKAQSGANDPTFNPTDVGFGFGDGPNKNIFTTLQQNDGKFIIGGEFTSYNGIIRNHIARLNVDGTLDNTFRSTTGANNIVRTIVVQNDGKIIIGGDFTSYNDTTRNRIARLNANGTIDTTFNLGTGANGSIYSIVLQNDGKIIISGEFTSYNGITTNWLTRLNADGSIDTTFKSGTGTNYNILTTVQQEDGKIIIGGRFTSYNGIKRNSIARLNADGTLDATFNPSTNINSSISKIAFQSDGRITIGGDLYFLDVPINFGIARLNSDGTSDMNFNFTTERIVSGGISTIQNDGKIIIYYIPEADISKVKYVRLNADGTQDNTFNADAIADNSIWGAIQQNDGKIILVGAFTLYNEIRVNGIARLNTDWTLDASFNTCKGTDGTVYTTVLHKDGKIIIGGKFTSWNGVPRNCIARLNADGTLDTTFDPGTSAKVPIKTATIQSDGKIVIGGDFYPNTGNIVRLNADGTLDQTFNLGAGANGPIETIVQQSDGKIIIGGWFTSYNGIERNGIVRLNADGTVDVAYNPNISSLNGYVLTIAMQSDKKILIGGVFGNINGSPRYHLARLNADGTLDDAFNLDVNPAVAIYWIGSIAIQKDGKIIIGGKFSLNDWNTMNNIVRLNADGTLDSTFIPSLGTDNTVKTITLQSDGKIVIGGEFNSYNGITRNGIARLNADGTLDETFNPGEGANNNVWTTAIQNDGNIIIGGEFTSYNGTGRNRIARILTTNTNALSSLQQKPVSVYPNPVSDELHIETDGNNEPVKFEILNMAGQVVSKGTLVEKTTVPTGTFAPGVYLIRLGNDKTFELKKVIKE